MTRWLVIGIGGVTCSGKTTVTSRLHKTLKNSIVINQDSYFLPEDDPRHVHITELNHHNWDILASMDMEKMLSDVLDILKPSNGVEYEINGKKKSPETCVLILDGILIFNYKPIAELCDVKYFLSLTKDQCWERRRLRVYVPPDVPGYFDKVVWPESKRYRTEIEKDKKLYEDIIFLDGMMGKEETFQRIFQDISKQFQP